MMNLSSTNEEIEALKYFLGEGNKAMNQLLVSNCETDIALLNDDSEKNVTSISYEREDVISNLMKIKALYTLILKQYYKTSCNDSKFFRGTNLAEVERLKNEPFIDKIISATQSLEVAETNFASNWNKPTCINLNLDSSIPYLIVKDVLPENTTKDVVIAPFTKIKNFELVEEKELAGNSKNIKVYNIELEKQELEELTDRERFGLYNYILENSYLAKVKLEECIKLDKENEINYENIRKLEQLRIKYENAAEDKEDEEDSDIDNQTDYDNIERVDKELEELKKTTTDIYETRRDNINFINMWKRNIAVYMIAECNEIEKKFLGIERPEPEKNETEESAEQEKDIILEEQKNELDEEKADVETAENDIDSEEIKLEKNEETIAPVIAPEENEECAKEEIEKEEQQEDTKEDKASSLDVNNEIWQRVKDEAQENITVSEELLENIKNLITKQQNHARIAGNIGSTYCALNNAFEMKNVAENMLEALKKVDIKIDDMKSEPNEDKLEEISKSNIEISTLINYLNNPKIALKNTRVTRFEEMAIIEENELKKRNCRKN